MAITGDRTVEPNLPVKGGAVVAEDSVTLDVEVTPQGGVLGDVEVASNINIPIVIAYASGPGGGISLGGLKGKGDGEDALARTEDGVVHSEFDPVLTPGLQGLGEGGAVGAELKTVDSVFIEEDFPEVLAVECGTAGGVVPDAEGEGLGAGLGGTIRIGEAALVVDEFRGVGLHRGEGQEGEDRGEEQMSCFHGLLGDLDFDLEEVGERRRVEGGRRTGDLLRIEGEVVCGIIALNSLPGCPVAKVTGDEDPVGAPGDSGDGHLVARTIEGTHGAEGGADILRVGVGEVFQQVGSLVVVGIARGIIDPYGQTVGYFPGVRHAVAIGIEVLTGFKEVEEGKHPGVIGGGEIFGLMGRVGRTEGRESSKLLAAYWPSPGGDRSLVPEGGEQDEVEGGFPLNVVVLESATVLKDATGKNKALLVRWEALHVLDEGLDALDGVAALDIEGDDTVVENANKDLRGPGASCQKAEEQDADEKVTESSGHCRKGRRRSAVKNQQGFWLSTAIR